MRLQVSHVEIAQPLWQLTWGGLCARGKGAREAACVWAGRREQGREVVQEVIFLDDYAGTFAGALHHCTPRQVTFEVFRLLRDRGLVIIADVHSHPAAWVDLSPVDKAHPIEYRVGLLAIVLPHFATVRPTVSAVGAHQYLGEGQWRRLSPWQARRMLKIAKESS